MDKGPSDDVARPFSSLEASHSLADKEAAGTFADGPVMDRTVGVKFIEILEKKLSSGCIRIHFASFRQNRILSSINPLK